jgi:hypothetical protein
LEVEEVGEGGTLMARSSWLLLTGAVATCAQQGRLTGRDEVLGGRLGDEAEGGKCSNTQE